jgi:GntR family transcriptional regulator of gluconate operon
MDTYSSTATTAPDQRHGGAEPRTRRRMLPPASRRQQVVDLLRDEIIKGELQPGEQLKQDVLCAEFAVSPAPVREALRQLESEGLVTHHPNHGVFVAEITSEDLLGLLLPVRLAIESHAVPKAAAELGPAGLGELEAIIAAMRTVAANGNLAQLNELDVRFHDLTVQMSGSAQALQLWRSVQPRIRAQIYRLAPRHADLAEIVLEHSQLLDAIRVGDPDSLRELLEEHIIGSARQLLAAVSAGQAASPGFVPFLSHPASGRLPADGGADVAGQRPAE